MSNDEVKIDKNIPLPRPGNAHYPWREMEVGDSFIHSGASQSSISGQCNAAGMRLGAKFACRKTTEGYRVWRVKP